MNNKMLSWGDRMEEEDRIKEIRNRRQRYSDHRKSSDNCIRSNSSGSKVDNGCMLKEKRDRERRRCRGSDATKRYADDEKLQRKVHKAEKPIMMLDRERRYSDCRTHPNSDKEPLSEVNGLMRSHESMMDCRKRRAVAVPVETDDRKLKTRQRQIDIGKNTDGYKNYMAEVDRVDRTKDHPWTPDKCTVCSTRSWQGVMRIWRRKLHFWDPAHLAKERENNFFDISVDKQLLNGFVCTDRNDSYLNDSLGTNGSQASSIEDTHTINERLFDSEDVSLNDY